MSFGHNEIQPREFKPIVTKTKERSAPKPIRKVSKKMATLKMEYSKLRHEFLKGIPICQICSCATSTDVHHSMGRRGGNLLKTSTWKSLCRQCHAKVHHDPKWAKSIGMLF